MECSDAAGRADPRTGRTAAAEESCRSTLSRDGRRHHVATASRDRENLGGYHLAPLRRVGSPRIVRRMTPPGVSRAARRMLEVPGVRSSLPRPSCHSAVVWIHGPPPWDEAHQHARPLRRAGRARAPDRRHTAGSRADPVVRLCARRAQGKSVRRAIEGTSFRLAVGGVRLLRWVMAPIAWLDYALRTSP